MEPQDSQKRMTSLSNDLEIEVDVNMSWDNRGFSINWDIVSGGEHFGEHLIPSMALHYIRGLCKDLGISFEQALRSSMGVPHTPYKDKINA